MTFFSVNLLDLVSQPIFFAVVIAVGALFFIWRKNNPITTKITKALPTLSLYTRDLTAEAAAGKLDPVIGRAEEIERVMQILSRRTKNNPVLLGRPGVGKTAIAEGLAQAIIKKQVPNLLQHKRVLAQLGLFPQSQ